MNSHHKSDGNICLSMISWSIRYIILFLSLVFFSACQTGGGTRVLEKDNPVRLADELDEEVSLKSDREQFAELRKDTPAPQKTANDELAMDLEMMAQVEKPAHEIRGKFQQKVPKLRQRFRDKSSNIRKKFRDTQKKQRDAFLKRLKEERSNFNKEKPDREKTKEFYAKQDLERKEFFAIQKEQRAEFESEMRQKSKDFHSNMRERIKQFDEQLRIYSKRKSEKEREEKKKEKAEKQKLKKAGGPVFKKNQKLDAETKKLLEEFDDMKSVPAEKLGN